MSETFKATLSPMLVMFICIVIGYVANKTHIIPKNAATVISKMENYIFVPALIVSTFMTHCTVESLKAEYSLIIYCIITLVIALALSISMSFLFERKEAYKRNIYRYALAFGNFSFMGNAIVPAILQSVDSDILYKYMLFTLPLNIAVYTWGVFILIPKGKGSDIIKSLINPVFISIIVGAVIGLTGASGYIPTAVVSTIDSLKQCMAPMAMLLTGFVIGSYDIKSLLSNKKIYIATVLRLVVLPLLFVGFLKLIGAPEVALLLTFFAYGTPLGLNTVVFPAAYGGETSTGASMAVISHTLCIITIPLLYSFLTVII